MSKYILVEAAPETNFFILLYAVFNKKSELYATLYVCDERCGSSIDPLRKMVLLSHFTIPDQLTSI